MGHLIPQRVYVKQWCSRCWCFYRWPLGTPLAAVAYGDGRRPLRGRPMTTMPQHLDDILEKDWQAQVVQLAKQLGWLTYHTFNSRRSTHGFPDLVLVRDRVIYLELKREKTRLTGEQKLWLGHLHNAGAEAYVARPRDLDALGQILASRDYSTTARAALSVALKDELDA